MERSMMHASLSVLAALAVVGCGGGGGATANVNLTDDNINAIAESAAKAMPGCVYSSAAGVSLSELDSGLLGSIRKSANLKTMFGSLGSDYTIDSTESGSCGGTVHKHGTHSNHDDDVTYDYDHYCSGDATNQTILNGSAHLLEDNTPSPSGPIRESTSVSTTGDGISIKSTQGSETQNATLSITNYKWTKDNKTTIDDLKYTSSDGTYEISGVDAEYDPDAGTYKVKSALYHDPDVGIVSISTTTMSKTDGGTITVEGSEGKAELTSTSDNPKKFWAKNEHGDTLGALDCSGVNGVE